MDKVACSVLVDRSTEHLDDIGVPPRWAETTKLRYLNEAMREAARRAHLIVDDETDEITLLDVVVGVSQQRVYPLHASVYDVLEVRWEDTARRLIPTREDILSRQRSNWRVSTSGRPSSWFVSIGSTGLLRLELSGFATAEDLQLRLKVRRLPLIECGMPDETELTAQDDEFLKHWVAHRCYQHRDPELYDPVKSAEELSMFEARFGQRQTREVERMKTEHHDPRTTARRI